MALMTSHHVAMLLLVLTAGHHVLKDLLIENNSINMSCPLAVVDWKHLFSRGVGWKRG